MPSCNDIKVYRLLSKYFFLTNNFVKKKSYKKLKKKTF